MKVLFHVGPHKTGTTSIQHFLARNGKKLEEQNFFTPNIPSIDGSPNQWYLVYVACEPEKRAMSYHNTRRGNHTVEECIEFRDRFEKGIRKALENAKRIEEATGKPSTFIISTEEVAYLVKEENNLLYRLFLEYSSNVDVLYYYRSPIDRIRSDVQQGSKGGHVLRSSLLENLPCQDTKRIGRFYPDAEIRDRVKISIVPYMRGIGDNHDWDVRLDFCKFAGINIEGLEIPAKDPGANTNMSLQMFSILQTVNQLMPSFIPGGQFNQLKRYFHEAVEAYRWTPEDTPFRFSRSDLDNLLKSREDMKAFLDLPQSEPSLFVDPRCQEVFESMASVSAEENVDGSIFTHKPTISHEYYVNVICYLWSYARRRALEKEQINVSPQIAP